MTENEGNPPAGQSRKERRMQWWSKQQQNLGQGIEGDTSGKSESKSKESKTKKNVESADALAPSEMKEKKLSEKSAKKFYVLFVGQIPYSATTEDVTKHFAQAAGNVKSFRLATHKDTGKSRGFGYVEFNNNKSYMRGLTMHLSKLHGRPINVEITSPGRGTSLFRKESLKRKNAEMARFRGIKEEGAGGGAMCIPSQSHPAGNKKKLSAKAKR